LRPQLDKKMNKYLLTEYYELCPNGICDDLLTEEEKRMVKEDNAMFLTGVMQRANHLNGNRRVYSKPILEREVDNYKKLVRERRALGELDHPDSAVINLANAAHLVTEVWWDGDAVMGKVQILNTPSGQILRSLVESGVKLGISSRGMGSVHEQGGQTIVEEDFQLICFDFVSEPSTTGAFMMQESKQPNIITKADRINRALNDILREK
tara:strand:- start:1044 stop:1670 length:627 start_codon:yes stop_codon:yes gene_type:complete